MAGVTDRANMVSAQNVAGGIALGSIQKNSMG